MGQQDLPEQKIVRVDDVHLHRHCSCPLDHGLAVVLVDIETEQIPFCDREGRPLYYCMKGHHIFACENMVYCP